MADTEDLVLSISADVRQMQRALQRITADTDKTTKVLQRQFNDLGNSTAATFDRTATSATRAFTVIDGGAKRVATSMRASSFQTGNLAAQLNDIGVQLAGGTSPFQIAIQQGTQINQILGGSGVRGAVSLLGGAFASLINPVSLATFAIIALGGTAIQYFTELLSSGEESEKTLKQQADLIRDVARQWGDALPAIKAYADELDRAKEASDRLAAGENLAAKLYEPLKQAAADLRVEAADFVSVLQQAGVESSTIDALQDSFNSLQSKIGDNKATTEDTEAAQKLLNEAMALGIGDAASLADALATLQGILAGVAAQAGAAREEIANLNSRGGIPVSDVKGGRGADPRSFVNDPYYQNRYFPDPAEQARPKRATGGGGRSGAASEAQREAEAVRKLIEQLQFEYDLIGSTEEQKAVANALRRAGSAATEEQKAKIEELILATEREREALKASEEAMKVFQDLGKDFLSGFINDLKSGKTAAEALENSLSRLADRLLDLALNSLFGGGGGIGGLLSGFFKNARGNAFEGGKVTPFARGGVVTRPTVFPMARGMGLMGEAGPEAVMPLARDYLGRLGVRGGGGGGGTTISMPISISAPGADAAQLARVERSVKELGRSIPKQIDARTRTKQVRNTRA